MDASTLDRAKTPGTVTARSPQSLPSVIPLTLTAMNRLRTHIPLYQPGGCVSIPSDDWASLRSALQERFNATLLVSETAVNPFLVIGHEKQGLPCLLIGLEFPEDVDQDDLVRFLDPQLQQLITRNIVAPMERQAA